MALSNRIVVMNHGRIEQIGPPNTIYEQPSTRFVRDFVGETVRLRGTIAGNRGGLLRIQIGACAIEMNGNERALPPAGSAVEVSFRPEDVRLQPHSPSAQGGLAGSVVEAIYFGDRLECAIRIDGSDEPVTIKTERRQRLGPNDRVALQVDAAGLKIWPL